MADAGLGVGVSAPPEALAPLAVAAAAATPVVAFGALAVPADVMGTELRP